MPVQWPAVDGRRRGRARASKAVVRSEDDAAFCPRKEKPMHEEPTAYRVPDPGIRALLPEHVGYRAGRAVEAPRAGARAELGITPAPAATEIGAKAKLSLLDRDAIRAGLARTGHSLVPLIWELDRVCEG